MNKEQILQVVRDGLNRGIISRSDLQDVNTAAVSQSTSKNSLVSKVFYALGAIIALIGIVVLVSDNWSEIGTAGRLIVTLGVALATYIGAIILHKKGIQSALVQIFFILSAALAPVSSFVLLDSLGVVNPYDVTNQVWIAVILLIIYGTALYITKRAILHVIVGLAFTWGYYATVAWMIRGSGFSLEAMRDIQVYTSMILGFAFLAYSIWLKGILRVMPNRSLQRAANLYNAFAFIFVLFPALFLVGIWDLLYAFLALGAILLSIQIRTTSGLIISAVSIAIYIIHISSKYFQNSVGWAAILVVVGFLIIGVGYLTFYLNKKYIARA